MIMLFSSSEIKGDIMVNALIKDRAISDLNDSVENLIAELRKIRDKDIRLKNASDLENLERKVHGIAAELADKISGIKLQQSMSEKDSVEEEKKIN